MKREIVQYPEDGGVYTHGSNVEPGTSPYPWQSTAGATVGKVWQNEDAVDGPTLPQGQWVVWPQQNFYSARVTFPAAPTLVRFNSITFETAWDTSQQGPNTWWYPPDNDAGPTLAIFITGRDGSTRIYGTKTLALTANNTNTNTEDPDPQIQTWELTSHPEGGPFTLEDVNTMEVGVGVWLTKGPNGKWNDDPIRFPKVRTFYLKRTLAVEDLGGHVGPMRSMTSLALRLMRRARNVIEPKVHVDKPPSRVGQHIYLSHPRGPSFDGAGWGRRRLERRAGFLVKRAYSPENFQTDDQIFDLSAYRCLGWGAYRIDTPWNPELQGVALIDKGHSFVHTRAQDAWSPRPGDGVVNRVIEAYPAVSFHGLPISGAGDESVALHNYNLTLSGWSTVGSAGAFSASSDASTTLVEEQGYMSCCKMVYGDATGAGGKERSLGVLGSGRLHVRVVIKNTSVPDPETENAEWYLREGTNYWNDTTRTWDASPAYNAIPSDEAFGEAVSDSIPIAGATYHVAVGRFSSQIGPVTFHGALVDVQFSDTTVAGARPPLATLAASIVRVADTHRIYHNWSRDLWDHQRGVAVAEVRPFWRAEDLPADAIKPLLHSQFVTNTWDAIQFVPKTGTDDLVRFERAMNGLSTFQLDCPIASIDLTRAHVLRAWARWLGSEGWSEYAPYSVEVGYAVFLESDGSLVGTGSVIGAMTETTAYPYDRQYLGIGCDESRYLDGYVRMWETRRNPIHRDEAVWRI